MTPIRLNTLARGLRTLQRPASVLLLPGQPMSGPHESGWPVASHDDALMAWRDWCVAQAGRRCRIALSCQWVMSGVVPMSEAATAHEAQSLMARQWDHYVNVGAEQLAAQGLVRTTRAGQSWLVCAMPRALVQDLQALAHAHGVGVVWMGPWWAAGAQRWWSHGARHGAGSAPRQLCAQEPGWSTRWIAEADQVSRLWVEPSIAPASPSGDGVTTVSLLRHGAASASCLWDDEATHRLISGRDAAWRGDA
ncbi:MAG TPA: hypothetical protein VFW84_12735 [Aquabacterium sp.]|uniref:hypothetical protein n=1 Tax=Aquabacterium sp. TaxID=1872578 RepID=UPI002E345870|nr:hypothetical protein [Aquabacterium sp.]HEX5373590.1 hypothetical protein [Aquabacterium sp.]